MINRVIDIIRNLEPRLSLFSSLTYSSVEILRRKPHTVMTVGFLLAMTDRKERDGFRSNKSLAFE